MAICETCNKEMLEGKSCIDLIMKCEGEIYNRIKYGDETLDWGSDEPCHDCAVVEGGYHHMGCDAERCPVCHGQLMSCNCNIDY